MANLMKKLLLTLLATVFLLSLSAALTGVKAEGELPTIGVSLRSNFSPSNIVQHEGISGAYGSRLGLDANLASEEGYSFAFWLVNGTVRFDLAREHQFVLTKDIDIEAVFSHEDAHAVLFMDTNGKLIDMQYVVHEGTAADITEGLPDKPGFQVASDPKWSGPLTNITANTVLILQYALDESSMFSLTVEGGTGSDTYLYNTVATVTPDAAPEETAFSHWKINGEIVSYDEEYKFSMLMDRTVEAVFLAEPLTPEPIIWLSDPLELRLGQSSFIGQIYIPEGYSLIDYGVLSAESLEDIALFGEGVTHHTGFKYFGPTKEFLMTFDTNHVAVKGYLVLEDIVEGALVYHYGEPYVIGGNKSYYLDYSGVSKSSYAAATITVDGREWLLDDALLGSLANDKFTGDQGIRFQNLGYIESVTPFLAGIYNIHFLHARYGTNDAADLIVEYALMSAPETWITVKTVTVTEVTLTAEEVILDIDQPLYLRIRKNGGDRLNIDNLIVNYNLYVDDVQPEFRGTQNGNIFEGNSFDPMSGVTAADNVDGDLTSQINWEVIDYPAITEPIDFESLSADVYTIKYTVQDQANNTATTFITLTVSEMTWDYVETFDNFTETGTSYSGKDSFIGIGGIEWFYNEVRGDQSIDGKSLMLRNNTTTYLYSYFTKGIGDFAVEFTNAFTTAAQLHLYINGSLIATSDQALDGVLTFSVQDINVEGLVHLELRVPSGRGQTLIDNLRWTSYGDPNSTAGFEDYLDVALELPSETTDDLTLPAAHIVGQVGFDISWSSGNTIYISDAGVVTRPSFETGNQTVTMTANVTDNNGQNYTFYYDVTVIALPAPDEPDVYTETFDTWGLPGSYTTSLTDVTGAYGISWQHIGARNDGGYAIDGETIMFRSNDATWNPLMQSATISTGIQSFSIDMRKAFTGGANNRQIRVTITPAVGDPIVRTSPTFGTSGTDTNVHTFAFDDFDPIQGNFTILVENLGAQVSLDNLSWTEYDPD